MGWELGIKSRKKQRGRRSFYGTVNRLRKGDAHLQNPRQQPRREYSKDFLRVWLRTRRIAEEAHQRCGPDKT